MKPSESHGCATGDCPHDDVNNCLAAVFEHADELYQTTLNGTECSQCLAKATEPVCMYCHECYSKQVREIERLTAERDALTEALTPSVGTQGAYAFDFTYGPVMVGMDDIKWQATQCVPWATVKDILKAIRERAAKTLEETK